MAGQITAEAARGFRRAERLSANGSQTAAEALAFWTHNEPLWRIRTIAGKVRRITATEAITAHEVRVAAEKRKRWAAEKRAFHNGD